MTTCTDRLNQVYVRLSTILQRPEVFGLGADMPQPLEDALEAVMTILGHAIEEKEQPAFEQDLEEELSQDADQFASTACQP